MPSWSIIAFASLLGAHYLDVAQAFPHEISTTSAEPSATEVHLERRLGTNDGSTAANAINVRLSCNNCNDNCDQNAYAILCQGQSSVMRRNGPDAAGASAAAGVNYQASGARYRPFALDANQMGQVGVYRPPTPNGELGFYSAEEFPWEGVTTGGTNALLFPVQNAQQCSQGGNVNTMYTRYGVDFDDYFNIVAFDNCDGPYCRAYNSNPKDYSVCNQGLTDPTLLDWGNYVFRRLSPPNAAYAFNFVGKQFVKKRSDHSLIKRDGTLNRNSDGVLVWASSDHSDDVAAADPNPNDKDTLII